MADVNLQLVREWFELHVFHVLTNWRQEPWRDRDGEHSPQLLVENTSPVAVRDLPFVLHPSEDLPYVDRAVVHVRAWHGDRFYPSVIEGSPVLSRYEADEAAAMAAQVFGDRPYRTLLVLSELPVGHSQRERSCQLLRAAGFDHVVEFPSLLMSLLNRISENANYAASPTLQTLRLLKRYKLVRQQQLEFPFPVEPPVPLDPPPVEVSDSPQELPDE
jgi:hypothetical protein